MDYRSSVQNFFWQVTLASFTFMKTERVSRFERANRMTVLETISWNDFTKVELRVGRVISAEVFPEARKPAYILHIDFGEEIGQRKSSAQITDIYAPEELIGKLVVAVLNFPKKQIGPLMSECLVTGFHNESEEVVLCVPDKPVPLGTKLL